jgi:hypothetical protein
MFGWLIHILGVDFTVPYGHWVWYNFWSGFESDATQIAIVGGLVAIVRKHNCEVHGCWRFGRHTTAAGHNVCRKHHPDDKLTADDVIAAHKAALSRP